MRHASEATPSAASSDAFAGLETGGTELTSVTPVRFLMGIGALLALVCCHTLLHHLHAILVPFVMAAFIVLTMQPTVEIMYRFFAGLAPPHRWGGCCCSRRTYSAKRSTSWSHFWTEADDSDTDTDRIVTLLSSPPEDLTVANLAEGVARFVAVTVVFLSILLLACLLIYGLFHGAMQMKANWGAYSAGIQRLEKWMVEARVNKVLIGTNVIDTLLNKAHDWVWVVVDKTVSSLSGGFTSATITLLYVLFWLLQPLPTGGRAGRLVRKYLYKKTFVSFLYGLCVTLLFAMLSIDMAVFFGMVSFFLNFVPEIGSIISLFVPIPVILLDGRLDHPFRLLAFAVIGQLVLKFTFANVLEVKLIERDREMSIHPVWVIMGLCYFGHIWGPIGMLISVPILALVKSTVMSMNGGPGPRRRSGPSMAGDYGASKEGRKLASQFIACLEGRKMEPESAARAPWEPIREA